MARMSRSGEGMREQLITARRLWPLTAMGLLTIGVFLVGIMVGPA